MLQCNQPKQPNQRIRGYDASSNEYDAVDDEEEGEKEGHVIAIVPRRSTPLREVVGAIFLRYPRHTVLGLSLMVAQAFFYNAIFFSYAIILVGAARAVLCAVCVVCCV